MNQAGFNLADRKELLGMVQNERLLHTESRRNKYSRLKSGLVMERLLSSRGWWDLSEQLPN